MRFLWFLMLLPAMVRADPLASCTNIGGGLTSPSYTITGTTYNICAACGAGRQTMSDVGSLSLNSGDAVLFRAGESFNMGGSESNRINAVSGVLYGRYGDGANPILSGAGTTFSLGFRGMIEADGDSNVTIDGIDFHNSPSFSIMIRDASSVSVGNLTCNESGASCVASIRGTDTFVDKIVIQGTLDHPHESITIDSTDGFVISNIRSTGNKFAALDIKGGANNGEVFGSEFSSTNTDPLFLFERAQNVHFHDNWIHTGAGLLKPLFVMSIEPLGSPDDWFERNHEINDNVIENTAQTAMRSWIKVGVHNPTAGADQLIANNHIHHNTIYNTGQSGSAFHYGFLTQDNRDPPDPDDWSGNIFENNIIWEHDGTDVSLQDGTDAGWTVRYNLYQTGATGDLGTNTIITSTVPFTDVANKDFDPAGPALGAGSDGSNVGATIQWTCGLGTDPDPSPTLSPITAAKPDPHTIDTLETHYPDHLWVFNDATGGTTIEDEGGSATDCDLTINGATQSSDTLGKYWVFNASETDTMTSSCSDPPTTTGVTCLIMSYPVPPSEVQTPVSWGDADDAFQVAAINLLNGSGAARAGICAGPDACNGNLNTGPVSITDESLNMACVRQSDSINDIWINDSGWQASAWAGSYLWSEVDKFTVGAQGRSTTNQYATGYVYAVFSYDGSKTDAEMSAIYNDTGSGGNPWAQIGIDPTSTPPNEVTSRGDYPAPAN